MQKFKISTALGCSRFWRFGGDRSAVGSLQVNDEEFILPGKMATALTQRARDDLGGGGGGVRWEIASWKIWHFESGLESRESFA